MPRWPAGNGVKGASTPIDGGEGPFTPRVRPSDGGKGPFTPKDLATGSNTSHGSFQERSSTTVGTRAAYPARD
jgi:hypothetical protein